MKLQYIPPITQAFFSHKILLKENVIKNIDSYLISPNNEGKAPSESKPLKKGKFDKIKIILNASLPTQEIEDDINNLSKNNNYFIKSEEKILQKKKEIRWQK